MAAGAAGVRRFRLADFLPYQISVASNAVSRAVALGTGYETRFGLSGSEWRVLAAVTAAGSPTQAELIALTGMDKMTISRAVTALSTRRLVDRVRDTGDRRTLRLSPTDEGRRIHDIVAPQALEVEQRLLAALSPGEADALRMALAKLREACGQT
jgi:DNA-binding MarR family transcriptional regulator